jgi:beta-galactosidase
MSFQCRSYPAYGPILLRLLLLAISQLANAFKTSNTQHYKPSVGGSRISINNGWQFLRTTTNVDNVIYDTRPDMNGTHFQVLKSWILPSANDFILDPNDRHERPAGNPATNISFVQLTFNDTKWTTVNLPHDWAIGGLFTLPQQLLSLAVWAGCPSRE